MHQVNVSALSAYGAEERIILRVKGLCFLVLFMSLATPRFVAEEGEGKTLQSADEIFAKLEKENQSRADHLKSYSSVRRYAVFEKSKPADATNSAYPGIR